jgi:hypothetical protein
VRAVQDLDAFERSHLRMSPQGGAMLRTQLNSS